MEVSRRTWLVFPVDFLILIIFLLLPVILWLDVPKNDVLGVYVCVCVYKIFSPIQS